MGVYNVSGVPVSASEDVLIAELKNANPSYTDDQLLAAAITEAQSRGYSSKIVWDGEDIHFTGQTTHICKGFGGIDFNNSKIYMPNYDNGIIIKIEPDSCEDITVSASVFHDTYTTSDSLKDKVFTVNDGTNDIGNAGMCLGYRQPTSQFNNAVIYACQTIKTSVDGYYKTGKMFMTPSTGDVICCNVHDFPRETFEVKNAEVVSYASANMSILVRCIRSNVHIHHFKFSGRSTVNSFHNGPFLVLNCSDIEVDHYYGINPILEANTSGYILQCARVANLYVHEISVGDIDSWGSFGGAFLTNSVFERCYLDRWDCHFAQYGYNVVRDCVLNRVNFGCGCGSLLFENCTLSNNRPSQNSMQWLINHRDDVVGVYDGDVVVRNCEFWEGKQAVGKLGIFYDSCAYAKPSNSALNLAPKKNRYIDKCRIPDGVKYIFQTGTATTADQPMFANLVYNVEDTIVGSGTTIINVLGGQSSTDATVTNYHKKIS